MTTNQVIKVAGLIKARVSLYLYESKAVYIWTSRSNYHLHEKQLAHLPLNESTRKMVIAKLHEGAAISSILDFVRDNVWEQMGRRELVTR